jgi:hypothetical protein
MIDEDLGAFFSPEDFGITATWRAGGTGAGVFVDGIFDSGHTSPSLSVLGVEDKEITFRCASADIPGAQQGDALIVDGTTYRVRSARPDGTGATILVLRV